jgi:signal transduction histidine kinase
MTVYVQFAIFFLQLIFHVTELVMGILIGREALRRRGQKHLALFSMYFTILGVGGLLWFLGGFFESQGFLGAGETLSSLFVLFTIVGSVFFGFAFTRLYLSTFWRRFMNVILVITAVLVWLITEGTATEAIGVYFAVSTEVSFIIMYGYWFMTNVLGIVLSFRSAYREKKKTGIIRHDDRFILVGCLLSIAGAILSELIIRAGHWEFSMLVYAVFTIAVIYKFFGATAKHNPDPAIVRNPYVVFQGTIMAKVLTVSAAFFAILTFMLLASTTNYFVDRSIAEQEARTRLTLATTAREVSKFYADLEYESALLSSCTDVRDILTASHGSSGRLADMLSSHGNTRWLDVVDTRGRVVVSTFEEHAKGMDMLESDLVVSSLEGTALSGTVWSDDISTWVIEAVSPIILSNGSIGGAVVLSAPLLDWSLPECIGADLVPASGCGFVSMAGETITSLGVTVDALTLQSFRSSISAETGYGHGQNNQYFSYSASPVRDSNGKWVGFVYSVVTQDDITKELFRVLSAIVIVIALFLAIALILLAFGIAILLRPLRILKTVANRVSKGDYGISLDYESPDEIGKLASAFNRMSLAIKDRTKSLNEKVREQRDFLSHTAHEIRTPLNIFRWSLEMLRFGDTGKLNNEQLELVEQMHQTNERMRSMVDEMLIVSKIEEGNVRLTREPVAIEDVIDEVAGEFSVKFREKMLDFYWKHPDDGLPKAKADRKLLSDVLANLVGNSVKFTDKEGHIFVAVSEMDTSGPGGRAGQYLHVQIEDNGRGIPDDQHKLVFKRFFRARNVVGQEIEGTGLGLYISKNIIEMHGGEIWFESDENLGSTFHFTVPVYSKGGDV